MVNKRKRWICKTYVPHPQNNKMIKQTNTIYTRQTTESEIRIPFPLLKTPFSIVRGRSENISPCLTSNCRILS